MNQAILFNDDIAFDEKQHCLRFTAMNMGMRIPCEIPLPPKMDKDVALSHFAELQFDYEADAEELIEAEAFSASGTITIQFINKS